MLCNYKRVALPFGNRTCRAFQPIKGQFSRIFQSRHALDKACNGHRQQCDEDDQNKPASHGHWSQKCHFGASKVITMSLRPNPQWLLLHRQMLGMGLGCLGNVPRTGFFKTASSGPLINAANATRPRASLLLTVPTAQPVMAAASS